MLNSKEFPCPMGDDTEVNQGFRTLTVCIDCKGINVITTIKQTEKGKIIIKYCDDCGQEDKVEQFDYE